MTATATTAASDAQARTSDRAKAFAECLHHGALRQKMARAGRGGEGIEVHCTAKFRKHRKHPNPQEPGTQHFFLDDDSVPELGGSRPDRLADVRPQERVPRRTVVQNVDLVPVVPLLHISEPQMVDSVVEVRKTLDSSLPDVEQVIEVPKIFLDVLPQRAVLREPQMAEQLVDVSMPETLVLVRGTDVAGVPWCQVVGNQGTRRGSSGG